MITVSRQEVMGLLKATGSSDRDVLYAAKEARGQHYRVIRFMSFIPMIGGAMLSLTIIGALVGIPMIAGGWFLRRWSGKQLRIIDDAFGEYTGAPRPSLAASAARGVA